MSRNIVRMVGVAVMVAALGGCVTHGGSGGGYGGGAPFAPYSGVSGAPGGLPGGYGQGYPVQGCGQGYPVQGCSGYAPGYGTGYGQQGSGGLGGYGGYGGKQILGGLGGAAAGGLAGAQIGSGSGQLAATAGGALLGLFLGSNIGKSLDQADEAWAWINVQRSLTANQPVVWRGEKSSGVVTPVRTVPKKRKSDQTCREFRHEVMIGDKTQEGVGRACLQRDGSWKLANG